VLNFGTCAFGKKRMIIGKATNDSTKAMVTPIDIIQPKSITDGNFGVFRVESYRYFF
jgi:hypothetical protein